MKTKSSNWSLYERGNACLIVYYQDTCKFVFKDGGFQVVLLTGIITSVTFRLMNIVYMDTVIYNVYGYIISIYNI